MTLFKDANYRVAFDGVTHTLEFFWEDDHAGMSYADFQEACSNFIGFGFEYQARNILIDVRNFQLHLPESFPEWQRTEHYPRYHKVGIQKVAYVMPAAALEHAREIDGEEQPFVLRNFSDMASAKKWLN